MSAAPSAATSGITVLPVRSGAERRRFLHFPWTVYRGIDAWVPPLISDFKKKLDTEHNPFYQHAEIELFLARRNGAVAGTVAAIIDHHYNSFQQFRQKMVVELAGGSTTIDAFATGTNFEGRKFYSSGWYEYLDPYLADPNKTDPDYDPDDFIRSVWDAQVFEGNRVAIPLNAVTWLLFYRKDVYEAAGLEVPRTMDELVANAAKVHGDNIYGFAGRGMKTQSVAEFGPFLYAYGGEWLDSDRRPAFNSPAGVKALETYVQLMQNYANPGAAENHWYDELALMQQGETAHIVDTAAWLGVLSDPEKSTVVDTVGFAHVPIVPGQEAKANLWSWNMAISSLSKKKDPAWLFIQWVTGKDMQLFIQSKNFPTARQSAWSSPEFAAVSNQEWLDAVLASFENATPMGHPAVVEVQQIEDVIGTAIVDAILGNKQAQAALDGAAEEVAEIMARTE